MIAMSGLKPVDVDDVIACAAAALARASGGAVTLDEVAPISGERRRNFIARARACWPDGRTRSVIVKTTRSPSYDPAAEKAFENSGLVRSGPRPRSSTLARPAAGTRRRCSAAMWRTASSSSRTSAAACARSITFCSTAPPRRPSAP
jgi:hypothetical protein